MFSYEQQTYDFLFKVCVFSGPLLESCTVPVGWYMFSTFLVIIYSVHVWWPPAGELYRTGGLVYV